MVGAEIIGEVELAGCALLHAHGGVVELKRRADLEGSAHHEALAVIERDGRKIEPERGIARQGPGGVARQHVDLAGLQRGETVLRCQRYEFDFGRVVENRRRDGAAEIDVEAGPIALRIGQAEARQRAVAAADKLTAILDRRKRFRAGRLHAGCKRHCQSQCRSEAFHKQTFQDVRPRPSAVYRDVHGSPAGRHLRTIALRGQGLTRADDAEVMAQLPRHRRDDGQE